MIVEAANARAPALKKTKFLAPTEMVVGQVRISLAWLRASCAEPTLTTLRERTQFVQEIKKHLVGATPDAMPEQQTIFVFCQNVLVNSSALMSQVYERFKSDDGFLYLKYSAENVFGALDVDDR